MSYLNDFLMRYESSKISKYELIVFLETDTFLTLLKVCSSFVGLVNEPTKDAKIHSNSTSRESLRILYLSLMSFRYIS